ncbi:hypothetical protein CDEST_08455 [Colletotrichum destructivum]|uniref:Uncharacterized protein n=1 Tax=Colletotrichum destructivum TaxID=34406 RepID=A0AAX4IKJ1_9PEZI|nr:hypothetical protein CDEST_08455 [Colletotrichum destructivum]
MSIAPAKSKPYLQSQLIDRDMPVSPRDANHQHEPFPLTSLHRQHARHAGDSIVMLSRGCLKTTHSSLNPVERDNPGRDVQGTPAFRMNS